MPLVLVSQNQFDIKAPLSTVFQVFMIFGIIIVSIEKNILDANSRIWILTPAEAVWHRRDTLCSLSSVHEIGN